jgi:hypothetical protein
VSNRIAQESLRKGSIILSAPDRVQSCSTLAAALRVSQGKNVGMGDRIWGWILAFKASAK